MSLKNHALILCLALLSGLIHDQVATAQELSASSIKQQADGLLRAGEYRQAADRYSAYLTIEPRSSAVWFNLAIARFQLGELDSAAAALEEVIQLDPADYEALYNLGCLSLYLKDLKRAEFHFRSSINACPNHSPLMGRIRDSLGFAQSLQRLDSQTQELALTLFLRQTGLFKT